MASGNTLYVWTALNAVLPLTGFAQLDRRNNHAVLDFDAGTDEAVLFEGAMPSTYSGNGITVTLIWLASSATSGDVVWTGAFERHDDDVTDLDSDSFASAQTATGTAASGSGEAQYTTIVFTSGQVDGVVAGESFRFRVTRDADNGSDTMAGDAELLRVILKET